MEPPKPEPVRELSEMARDERRNLRHFGAFYLLIALGLPGWFAVPATYGIFATAITVAVTWRWGAAFGFALGRGIAKRWWTIILFLGTIVFGGYGWLAIITGQPQSVQELIRNVFGYSLSAFLIYRLGKRRKAPPESEAAEGLVPEPPPQVRA